MLSAAFKWLHTFALLLVLSCSERPLPPASSLHHHEDIAGPHLKHSLHNVTQKPRRHPSVHERHAVSDRAMHSQVEAVPESPPGDLDGNEWATLMDHLDDEKRPPDIKEAKRVLAKFYGADSPMFKSAFPEEEEKPSPAHALLAASKSEAKQRIKDTAGLDQVRESENLSTGISAEDYEKLTDRLQDEKHPPDTKEMLQILKTLNVDGVEEPAAIDRTDASETQAAQKPPSGSALAQLHGPGSLQMDDVPDMSRHPLSLDEQYLLRHQDSPIRWEQRVNRDFISPEEKQVQTINRTLKELEETNPEMFPPEKYAEPKPSELQLNASVSQLAQGSYPDDWQRRGTRSLLQIHSAGQQPTYAKQIQKEGEPYRVKFGKKFRDPLPQRLEAVRQAVRDTYAAYWGDPEKPPKQIEMAPLRNNGYGGHQPVQWDMVPFSLYNRANAWKKDGAGGLKYSYELRKYAGEVKNHMSENYRLFDHINSPPGEDKPEYKTTATEIGKIAEQLNLADDQSGIGVDKPYNT